MADKPTKPQWQLDRRAFVRAAFASSAALAAGSLLPLRLLADAPAGVAIPATGAVDSARRMGELLRRIARESDPMKNPFRSADRVAALRATLAGTSDPHELFKVKMQLADELLQSGKPEEALTEFDSIERLMLENDIPRDDYLAGLLTTRALCHLRIGELENCCANHNADSCLFPIGGRGIHTLKRGSRGAISVLSELLERYPSDLRARWLLNIAFMTLGDYPAKVPQRWLLEPSLFASDHDVGRFPDIAASVGLDIDGLAGGLVLEDFDNDGFLDVMVSSWGLEKQLRLFHNNGDGTFTEHTEKAGLLGELGGLNLLSCDINNDGTQDIYSVVGGAVDGDNYHHQLFANPGHGNNWLKLKLEGVRTNRAAIGARIKVVLPADGGERCIFRTVCSGASFGSSSFRQEIGLGPAPGIKRVEILWPVTGQTQVLTGLEVNRLYHVREGADAATQVTLRSFSWPASARA